MAFAVGDTNPDFQSSPPPLKRWATLQMQSDGTPTALARLVLQFTP